MRRRHEEMNEYHSANVVGRRASVWSINSVTFIFVYCEWTSHLVVSDPSRTSYMSGHVCRINWLRTISSTDDFRGKLRFLAVLRTTTRCVLSSVFWCAVTSEKKRSESAHLIFWLAKSLYCRMHSVRIWCQRRRSQKSLSVNTSRKHARTTQRPTLFHSLGSTCRVLSRKRI